MISRMRTEGGGVTRRTWASQTGFVHLYTSCLPGAVIFILIFKTQMYTNNYTYQRGDRELSSSFHTLGSPSQIKDMCESLGKPIAEYGNTSVGYMTVQLVYFYLALTA